MKIGFVLDDSLDKPDGVQQYILTMGAWFASQGHEVHYLVGETVRTDIRHVHSLSKNIKVRFNQNRMSIPLPVRRRRMRELLAREDFDVLHVQMPYSPMLAAKIIQAAPARTAIVGTFHILPYSLVEKTATRMLGHALRRSLRRFDKFVSVSAPAAAFARKSFGIASDVVPNVVDVAAYRGAPKPKADKNLHIVFLGRLVERKGCRELLRALAVLAAAKALQNVRVHICGRGPLDAELQQFATSSGLKDVVGFVGFVSEAQKQSFLANAHIAVFPSLGGESFGIVLIEAMAAGAEVVLAGNNPGYASVMDERTEQLIDPADTQAFAAVLKRFIRDESARKTAQNWQRDHVAQYDVASVGQTLTRIYAEAIAKRAGSSNNDEQETL